MKSKWKKGLLLIGIVILIVVAAKAAMFYGVGHPYMERMHEGGGQLKQQFHDGMEQGNHHSFSQHREGREHPYSFDKGHRGGFWFGSLLTLAFWGGLLLLVFTWLRKRKANRMGRNFAMESFSLIQSQTSTNAAFLDQWEKEHTQVKEEK